MLASRIPSHTGVTADSANDVLMMCQIWYLFAMCVYNVYVVCVCVCACFLCSGYWRVGVIGAYTGARTAEAIVSEGINLARSTANERLSGKSSGVSGPTVYWIRNTELYKVFH